jgi:hypothetical protein
MDEKAILPVEGNPNDEVLCICALRKANLKNLFVIAHDEGEALEFLFGDGVEALPRIAPTRHADAGRDDLRSASRHFPRLCFRRQQASATPIDSKEFSNAVMRLGFMG